MSRRIAYRSLQPGRALRSESHRLCLGAPHAWTQAHSMREPRSITRRLCLSPRHTRGEAHSTRLATASRVGTIGAASNEEVRWRRSRPAGRWPGPGEQDDHEGEVAPRVEFTGGYVVALDDARLNASDIDEEYYASFTLDRAAKKHLLMLAN